MSVVAPGVPGSMARLGFAHSELGRAAVDAVLQHPQQDAVSPFRAGRSGSAAGWARSRWNSHRSATVRRALGLGKTIGGVACQGRLHRMRPVQASANSNVRADSPSGSRITSSMPGHGAA